MAKTVSFLAPGGAAGAQNFAKVPADRKLSFANIAGDANYPAGGYPVAPGDLGFAESIDFLAIVNETVSPNEWFWNRATQKLQLIVVATGVELAAASNASALSCDVWAFGL